VKHFFNQNYWIIIPFILYLMHSDAFGAPKPWTILISMSITPDLEKFAISNLLQLESQIDGTQLKADIVVQAEEKTSGIVRRFLITPRRTPAPPLNRPEDLASLELIQIESSKLEEFFAHPLIPAEKRLRSFIRWATEAYPSENLMLILWGHGEGWKTLSELNLRTHLARLRWHRQKPIDILAWDACYMQSLENAVEVAPWTRFVCGSEDIESYVGYDYKNLVKFITRPDPSPQTQCAQADQELQTKDPVMRIAAAIPSIYKASFETTANEPTSGYRREMDPSMTEKLTGCAIESQILLDQFLPALDQLAQSLQKYTSLAANWGTLRALIESTPTYRGGTRDLGIFLKELKEEIKKQMTPSTASEMNALIAKINQTCDALNQSVVRRALGSNYLSPDPTEVCVPSGVSVFLPQTRSEFHEKLKSISHASLYQTLPLFRIQSSWANWVTSMY
jgi:hypothetical protein